MNTTPLGRICCLAAVLLACAVPRALGQCLEWQDVTGSGTRPPQASEHAVVYDSCRGVIAHFGGFDGASASDLNQTWEWSCATRTWIQRTPPTSPPARHSHNMAFDAARCKTVLFGGSQTTVTSNDTWEYDGSNWVQRCVSPEVCTPPSARIGHGMTYDSARHVVVLFGGHAGGSDLGDTWEWDGTGWTFKTNSGPSIREYPAMAYDRDCGRTLLFGGQSPRSNDTWMWDGTAWTSLGSGGPSQRYAAAMSYDQVRRRMVLFGGNAGPGSNETWEWMWSGGCSNGSWSQVSATTQPGARFHTGMAFAESCSNTVLFGGWVSPADRRDDTWMYGGRISCPTLSEWGVGVMGLLLLTAGTIVVNRRRVPAS